MKINSITIKNIDIYRKLKQIFKNKKPTSQIVLIYKLFIEGQINQEEAKILNNANNQIKGGEGGGGFKLLMKINSTSRNSNKRLELYS